jgi:hypothetical protein
LAVAEVVLTGFRGNNRFTSIKKFVLAFKVPRGGPRWRPNTCSKKYLTQSVRLTAVLTVLLALACLPLEPVQVLAQGYAIEASLPQPTPTLVAFPEAGVVEGLDWPLGSVVHLSIDDPATGISPDFERDGTVGQRPGIPGTHVRIGFEGEYDLKVGDLVTLTDGSTTQTHVVRNLAVTAVDTSADTVTGTADPGAVVQSWIEDGPIVQVTAG